MTVEVLDGLNRRLSIAIAKNEINAQVSGELMKYAKNAKLPGFRPGKVPMKHVEQAYGTTAYEDVLKRVLNDKFSQLVDEQKIEIVSYPKFNIKSSEGEEYLFTADFEVMPEICLGDLSTHEVEKPICGVGEQLVDTTVENLRLSRSSYSEVKRAVQKTDKVTIDFIGTVDGVEFEGGSAVDYVFITGQSRMLPEFEAGVVGILPEESRNVTVNFPEDYHKEDLRNKQAVFNITIKKVEEAVLPELNEEFIKSIGIASGDVDELRKEVHVNLNRQVDLQLRNKLHSNILKALSDANPIDVPHSLEHDEIHVMMERFKEDMKNRGYSADQLTLTHEMFAAEANTRVKQRLLIQHYIKENNVAVNSDDIKVVIAGLAQMYEDPNNYTAWYYEDEKRLEEAKAIALENKVMTKLLQLFKVVEKEVNYEDLIKGVI